MKLEGKEITRSVIDILAMKATRLNLGDSTDALNQGRKSFAIVRFIPSDFWSQESPQSLLAPLTGQFEYEKQFGNLKFISRRPRNVDHDVWNFP